MRYKTTEAIDSGQTSLDQIDIASIKLDLDSRDQIPQILLGSRYLHQDEVILNEVYEILEKEIICDCGIQGNTGRLGMSLWQILVSGVLRLNNNWDYDHLENMIGSHREIRQMLGLGFWDDATQFKRKTLINNISLIAPEVFNEISELTVKAGHRFLEVESKELKTRVDSFVVESNVKHPTDSNLLMDSIGKVFHVIQYLENYLETTVIEQSKQELKKIRELFNKVRKSRRSNSKNEVTTQVCS